MTIQLILQILYLITLIGIIIVVLLENNDPRKTIVWLLTLVFIPFFGIILYFVFGEDHRRTKSVLKRLYKNIEPENALKFTIADSDEVLPEYQKQVILFKETNRAPILGENKIDFFSTATELYNQLFIDIEKATHHVHLIYYIFEADNIGNRLKDLLIKKARQGVEIRLVYDDFGSISTPKKFFDEMRTEGVEVELFLPIRFPRIATRLNYRNHRKIVVIDGQIGFTGGMNISDRYINGYDWGIWRDLQIRIQGKGAQGLQMTFIVDWYYTHKLKLDQPVYFPEVKKQGDVPLQIVSSGPNDPYESISSGFFEAINNAKKYVYLETPYFIPSDHILKSLQLAAISGIDVRIVLPRKSDSMLVDAATFSYVESLLKSGIKVYFYQKGFIHSKIILVDDYLFSVGSANMDSRSFEINFETNAFIYHKETTLKAKQIFYTDIKDSKPIDLHTWQKRAWTRKIGESVMRLLAPLF